MKKDFTSLVSSAKVGRTAGLGTWAARKKTSTSNNRFPTTTLGNDNNFGRLSPGFTLIELLVVVLIIGILSAVALPQYTRAVEKSRVAEAKTVLKAIAQAQDAYMLASPDGGPTDDFSQLDITIPNSGKWSYWLEENIGAGTYALGAELPNKDYVIFYMKGYGPEDGEFYCSPMDSANKGCEIFGGTLFEQASTGWDLVKL
ncbi:type IV pilin protein [Candidatus Avelusimicrobium sp.]|uniref:type IV pilin protein n=1 Tax=Candidatus Avelusimicrobium sp. TaxID=3048833 RepID=UPI003D7CDE91